MWLIRFTTEILANNCNQWFVLKSLPSAPTQTSSSHHQETGVSGNSSSRPSPPGIFPFPKVGNNNFPFQSPFPIVLAFIESVSKKTFDFFAREYQVGITNLSFPVPTIFHSHSQKLEYPFQFPFPKFGNGLSHSRS